MYKLRCISKLVSLHSSKHVSLHSSTTACTSCAPNTSEIDPARCVPPPTNRQKREKTPITIYFHNFFILTSRSYSCRV